MVFLRSPHPVLGVTPSPQAVLPFGFLLGLSSIVSVGFIRSCLSGHVSVVFPSRLSGRVSLGFTRSCFPHVSVGFIRLCFCQVYPVMFPSRLLLCSEPVSPNRPREQVHHSNARQEGSLFIPSALGPKSHPTQGNPTRAPNKGVWQLLYRQFFVSVTGVAGVT